jgi:hypothetical protein
MYVPSVYVFIYMENLFEVELTVENIDIGVFLMYLCMYV